MTVIESAVAWAINTANDNAHGYSQANRWGNPDYDCSSFVITAYEQAGVHVKQAGASYTGNMRGAFIACGFVDVTYEVGLSTGYGIQPGDVLLNYASHTCIAVGGGKVANCRSSDGHPEGGDQTGNEIRIQNYWNYPWNCVLRYKGTQQVKKPNNFGTSQDTSGSSASYQQVSHNWKPTELKHGARGTDVYVLQALLIARNFFTNNNPKEIDGQFGAKTQAAVNSAKQFYGMLANGECDLPLWKRLIEVG